MHLLSRITLLALLTVAMLLPGCYEDEGNDNPVKPSTPMHEFFSLMDTVYAAVNDSAIFDFDSYLFYDADLYLLMEYGDGTSDYVLYDRYQPEGYTHAYPALGTYTAYASVLLNQTVIAKDTITVIVQDYVRPSKFKTMTITVTGLDLFFYNVITRSGLKDSVFITSERDFTFSSARWDEYLPAPTWIWRYDNSAQRSQSGGMNGGKASCNMHVRFATDGSRLEYVGSYSEFTDNRGDTTYFEKRDPHIRGWLSLSGPASLQSATYTHTIPQERWHSVHFDPHITEERTAEGFSHVKRIFHIEPYSDVTITVEFTK